jgi:hypothetical protein
MQANGNLHFLCGRTQTNSVQAMMAKSRILLLQGNKQLNNHISEKGKTIFVMKTVKKTSFHETGSNTFFKTVFTQEGTPLFLRFYFNITQS